MFPWKLTFFLTCIIAVVVFHWAIQAQRESVVPIDIAVEDIDLGDIQPDSRTPFSMIICNNTAKQLFLSLESSCGCATLDDDVVSVAGMSALQVDGVFSAPNMLGKTEQSFVLTHESGLCWPVKLKANVAADFLCVPDEVRLYQSEASSKSSEVVCVYSKTKAIKSVSPSLSYIQADVISRGSDSTLIKISFNPEKMPFNKSRTEGSIQIEFDNLEEGPQTLPLIVEYSR